jgi:hypothetical protein
VVQSGRPLARTIISLGSPSRAVLGGLVLWTWGRGPLPLRSLLVLLGAVGQVEPHAKPLWRVRLNVPQQVGQVVVLCALLLLRLPFLVLAGWTVLHRHRDGPGWRTHHQGPHTASGFNLNGISASPQSSLSAPQLERNLRLDFMFKLSGTHILLGHQVVQLQLGDGMDPGVAQEGPHSVADRQDAQGHGQ